MSQYRIYSKCLIRSVEYIFNNLLEQEFIDLSAETQAKNGTLTVSVEVAGTLQGELIYLYPQATIRKVFGKMMPNGPKKMGKNAMVDVAKELSNMITGNFVNQMQYLDHDIIVHPPEIRDEKEEYMRALFESVNLSFTSSLGGFDVDFYYREKLP